MDSIFSALVLERLVRFLTNVAQKKKEDKFDIIVYDGISSDETLRMIGAASKARLGIACFLFVCLYFCVCVCGFLCDFIISLFNNIIVYRLYLKYLRNLAEKTDLGRLVGPSLLRLVDEAMNLGGRGYSNGIASAEIWDNLERMLEVNVIHIS